MGTKIPRSILVVNDLSVAEIQILFLKQAIVLSLYFNSK